MKSLFLSFYDISFLHWSRRVQPRSTPTSVDAPHTHPWRSFYDISFLHWSRRVQPRSTPTSVDAPHTHPWRSDYEPLGIYCLNRKQNLCPGPFAHYRTTSVCRAEREAPVRRMQNHFFLKYSKFLTCFWRADIISPGKTPSPCGDLNPAPRGLAWWGM